MANVGLKKQFEEIFRGGNLRSLGQAHVAIGLVNDQKTFDQLFTLIDHPNRVIAMRAADVIEKITIQHPSYLATHKISLLKLCTKAEHPEIKWHLALIVPRMKLTKKEIGIAWDVLTNWATNIKAGRIVRVNAVQGMYELLKQYTDLQLDFEVTINEIYRENIPSLNARIRMLRKAKAQGNAFLIQK